MLAAEDAPARVAAKLASPTARTSNRLVPWLLEMDALRQALAAEGGTTSETIQDRADLEAAMATLEKTIWNTFLGSGQRRE